MKNLSKSLSCLCVITLLVAMCAGFTVKVNATDNLSLGFIPYGSSTIKYYNEDGEYKLTYKKMLGGNIAYEYTSSNSCLGFLAELSFAMAKLDSINLNKNIYLYEEDDISDFEMRRILTNKDFNKNFKSFGGAIYLGCTIFPKQRFQLPIYVGAACDYVMADPVKNVAISAVGKVRMKFYPTYKVGIYAGASYKLGILTGGDKPYYDGKTHGNKFNGFNIDAGIIFSF